MHSERLDSFVRPAYGLAFVLGLMVWATPASYAQIPPGVNIDRGFPGAVLNYEVQQFNLYKNQPYLNSPINPEGKKPFIPDEPEIIYDESLKRHTQIQGQIIGPDPVISAPEP